VVAACPLILGLQPIHASAATTSVNNGLIAVGGEYSIGVVAADDSARYTVLNKLNDYQFWGTPAWSPDGSTLAVDSDDESENGNGWTVRVGDRLGNLEPFQISGEDPTWTPDGDLVVVREGPNRSESTLWLVDRNGQDIRPLNIGGPSVLITDPRVSPDGRTVAYERRAAGDPYAIYTAPISGGTEQRVDTGQTQFTSSVDWSPDGTHLLFVGDDALWTIGADNTGRTQIVPPSENVESATWSPDGSLIAYYSGATGSLRILDVSTETSRPGPNYEPVWYGLDWQPLPACSVQGTDAADSLTGTAGDDVICAGGGDDVIQETPGDDIVLGGEGQDLVEYDTTLPGVQVNLERVHARGAGDDIPLATEGVVGTDGPDTLVGDHNAETLMGGAGDDTIAGGRGVDKLAGGDGRDTLTSNYDENQEYNGYDIDLVAGTSVERTLTGDPVVDTLSGFEDVIGTPDADLIRGDGTDNVLQGSPVPTYESDEFEGRGGADTIIGPGTAIYSQAPSAVDVDLVGGTASGGDGNDTLAGPTGAQGSSYGDHFRLARYSVVHANEGNDSAVLTNVGNFHGGPGRDLADLSGLPWGVRVADQYGIWDRGYNRTFLHYEMTDVERYVLTPFVDTFEGSAESEVVSAGRGNDWIYPGPQSVTGPNGPVRDTLLGGRGTDTIVGQWMTSPLVLDLATGWGQAPGVDVVRGFEDVRGSPYDDRISGNDLANELWGNAGDDVLRGRAGPDTLIGGLGADTLLGGRGADTCGSAPKDTVTSCP
jgi:Ca2+-binding RTX toxin-like protein